ncbi:MAG: ComF family protein [Psychromonas sp.]|uniref:ComF family protein n=1 Tax=Psychromonas sp. TaxID=1884585 RepID=UPI0039E6C20C
MQTVTAFIKQKLKQLIELFLPARCLMCELSSNDRLICGPCQTALLEARTCCQRCGLALNICLPFCGDCLKQAHLFEQLHALGSYQPPYSQMVKKLKYTKQLLYGELLGELLSESIVLNLSAQQLSRVDYLLPVPLHTKKQRTRGFNQAQIIAQVVGKHLNIPLILEGVNRQINTRAQEGLTLNNRKKNLNGAFSISLAVQQEITGAHIVIIDDVVTTGATANSLCQTLLKAGAQRIDIWCCCRTSLSTQK